MLRKIENMSGVHQTEINLSPRSVEIYGTTSAVCIIYAMSLNDLGACVNLKLLQFLRSLLKDGGFLKQPWIESLI